MGDSSCPRIRFVLALDRRRIRDLIGVAPPQPHWKLLDFSLIVIADENLGVVAYVVVNACRELLIVLVENLRLHIVESTGRIGVCIGMRVQIHQCLHVRVNQVR